MSAQQRPSHINLPPQSASFTSSALDTDDTPPALGSDRRSPALRPAGARVSFSTAARQRPSMSHRWRAIADEEGGGDAIERPPIPNALKPVGGATPLPFLSILVLSITMLGEFLSANVSTPFILDMVAGFGEFEDEADAAAWTGILVSAFFLTQFATSLLWATVADKYGQRTVLFTSLLGSAFTCAIFGTATSLREAIAIRLLQGIFAGAIGVARGGVTFVTDPSNEGRAYAILGFCWGFGGVAGAIVGGSFESPAKKWPGTFEHIPLFVHYPYLLPTLIASSITTTGAILSLFLARDGGPRGGAIQLPEKPDDAPDAPLVTDGPLEAQSPLTPTSKMGSIGRRVSKKISGYFSKASDLSTASDSVSTPAMPLGVPSPQGRARAPSHGAGSAYGYGSPYRSRLLSTASIGARRGSMANSLLRRRGGSNAADLRGSFAPSSVGTQGDLSFAQRLVLANENAVTNIADLWVASAINADNEEVFVSDDEEALAEEGDEGEVVTSVPASSSSTLLTPPAAGIQGGNRKPSMNLGVGRRPRGSPGPRGSRSTSTSTVRASISGARRPSPSIRGTGSSLLAEDAQMRRGSFATAGLPAIFSNTGLKTPPALLEAPPTPAQPLGALSPDSATNEPTLATIVESRRVSLLTPPNEVQVEEKPQSMMKQLPVSIIIQYGLIALHTTTHDQVFLSYLVSPYQSGGLNLNPGHFSQIIALMSLAQIVFQFYLYPNIGPPRGRFSHMAMFRIGSALFIPAYITVTLYRSFANEHSQGSILVMSALTVSTAVRFCGNTFGYTSISILLNYMSPPHLVGYANGIAQSIVSLMRFLGPIFGGQLWAVSVKDDPSGYPFGFFVCAGVCGLAILHTFFIR